MALIPFEERFDVRDKSILHSEMFSTITAVEKLLLTVSATVELLDMENLIRMS